MNMKVTNYSIIYNYTPEAILIPTLKNFKDFLHFSEYCLVIKNFSSKDKQHEKYRMQMEENRYNCTYNFHVSI